MKLVTNVLLRIRFPGSNSPKCGSCEFVRSLGTPRQVGNFVHSFRVSKRDARHYFHILESGSRWRGYLGGPPIRKHGKTMVHCSRAWPMGLKLSAAVAHRITELYASRAKFFKNLGFLLTSRARLSPPCGGRSWMMFG